MIKAKTKFIYSIIMLFVAVSLSTASVLAWFANNNQTDVTISKSTIIKQYFHTGDGSKENPFVITRPIHYYNLVQLYQRKDGFAEEGYHFQLGYNLDKSDDGSLEVYNYSDAGKLTNNTKDGTYNNTNYSNSLNMKFYSGDNALLPIGTSDVPFIAEFDGSGLIIDNLSIKASDTIGNNTFGTSDVGIFGYVTSSFKVAPEQPTNQNFEDNEYYTRGGSEGSYYYSLATEYQNATTYYVEDIVASIHDIYYRNVSISLADTDATRTNENHNEAVHMSKNSEVADLVFVGYIAGHIRISTNVDNVFINNCTINGKDKASTGYGYFGCVEKTDGTLVSTLGSEVATVRGRGDESGFGGSLDMKNMLERLEDIWSVASTPATYNSSETYKIDEVSGTKTLISSGTSTFTADSSNGITFSYRYYEGEKLENISTIDVQIWQIIDLCVCMVKVLDILKQ